MSKAMPRKPESATARAPAAAPASVQLGKTVPKEKRRSGPRSRAASSLSLPTAQRLIASTGRLAQAVSDFAVKSRLGTEPPVDEFQKAYASIVRLIPKNARIHVLSAMRRGIDEVVRAETGETDSLQQKSDGRNTADFMAELRRQEQVQRQQEITTGELIPGSEMQARLKITPQALSAAMKRRRIFAVKGASGKYFYPAFFADPSYDRATLERVSQALGGLPSSTKLNFFTNPRHSLRGRSPLQAIAMGRVDEVLNQANALREA